MDTLVLLCEGAPHETGLYATPGGSTWLRRQLEACKEVGVSRVVLVLGEGAESYLKAQPWAGSGLDVRVVSAPLHSALRCGLQEIPDGQGAFVLPERVPCPNPGTWRALDRALQTSQSLALRPSFEGTGGYPVYLSAPLAKDLRQTGSELETVLTQLGPFKARRLSLSDEGVVRTLRTRADFEAYFSA